MSVSSFIPNGRTSRVKKGSASLQIQTEYALRPYPRLTTTILNDGQVLHKIEKKLDRPIKSIEEQTEIERMIKRQHAEVVSIVEEHASGKPSVLEVLSDSHTEYVTLCDHIKAIPGVQSVYELDPEGNFLQQESADQFRKAFSVVFKGLRELLDIFSEIPGITLTRERGVYEVERDKLYLVSAGDEICFVTVRRTTGSIVYEQALNKALTDFFKET